MPSPNLEAAILALLRAREPGKTICPSDAARVIDPTEWRPLMQPIRDAALRLVAAGHIIVTQHGRPVDPSTTKGPIRLRLR